MNGQLAAPAISAGLLVFWAIVGHSLLGVLRSRGHLGQNLLLAPAVGVAATVLPLFWSSWLGIPVLGSGPWLGAVLFVSSMTILLWRRPRFPVRRALAFALPGAAAFILTGWPLFKNGFAWLSYGNNDMANYCLMAVRLLHRGLLEPPSAAELTGGVDLSLTSWPLEISTGRPGSQLLVAWISSLTGRNPLELYMPAILALHVSLVFAAGGLVYRRRWLRGAALATCWLMAASALTTLGTIAQLIAQVCGLLLGCALVALAWESEGSSPSRWARGVFLLSVVAAAFLLVYPEFAPFVALALLCRIGIEAMRRSDGIVRHLAMWGASAAVLLLLLAPYGGKIFLFLRSQTMRGAIAPMPVLREIFPYYLIPSGIANLWGFQPHALPVAEPWMSVQIILGAILLAAVVIRAFRLVAHGEAAPTLLLVHCAAAAVLFRQRSAFGLFKLAMFIQPFLLGTLAIPILRGGRFSFRRAQPVFVVLIALSGLSTQRFYTRSSLSGFTEVHDQRKAVETFRRLAALSPTSVSVDSNLVLEKLQALYARGIPERIISGDLRFVTPRGDATPAESRAIGEILSDVSSATVKDRRFDMLDPADPTRTAQFTLTENPVALGAEAGATPRCDTLLTVGPSESLFNRSTTSADGVMLLPCANVRDHLALVTSSTGRAYDNGDADAPIGVFGIEPDYFFQGRTMAGLGRSLVFEIINPSASVRLLLDLTATLKADGQNVLPPAAAIGKTRVPFEFVGRGSGRVFSPPFEPRMIDGHAFLALDLGVAGTLYPARPRSALMALFGRDVREDPRRIVALGRDVSLVSEAGYRATTPPVRLAHLPADLADPSLEYSGLYEDGWMAETVYAKLTRPAGDAVLVVKGEMLAGPQPDRSRTLDVYVDGRPVAHVRQAPGPFVVRASLGAVGSRVAKVSVRSSGVRALSSADARPASAHLEAIGFEPLPLVKKP